MYNKDTEFLFPPRVIPSLRGIREGFWEELVEQVSVLDEMSIDRLAFILLMTRLGKCSSCQASSYRALRGCTKCSRQAVRRFRGSDQELLKLYNKAHEDVTIFIKQNSEQMITP